MSNDPTPPTRDITLTIELDATPEEVFRAVTDGVELAKWLAPEARVTPPEGSTPGRVWISWGEGMSAEHEIELYEAPRRLRHPSGSNSQTHAPLYADWIIEAGAGGTTTLRLVHSGFSVGADWDDEFEAHERGWRLMLQNLRHYFTRHRGADALHLPHMASVDGPRAALWARLLERVGLSTTPQVGDRFRWVGADGEVFTGAVDLVRPDRDLALVIRERDDALVRVNLEGKAAAPATFVYAYAIAYGDRREAARELLAAIQAALA